MAFNNDPQNGWDDPLAGVKVTVVTGDTGAALGSATTDASGAFRIGKLPVGLVKVRASASGWSTSWAPGIRTRAEGAVYQVRGGQVTTIELISFFAPAAMEGQVLSQMDPIGPATVTVYDASTRRVIASVTTNGEGHYRIEGLWADWNTRVKVRASKDGFTPNWADSYAQNTWDTATVFTLSPGVTLRQTWSGPPPSLYLTSSVRRRSKARSSATSTRSAERWARCSTLTPELRSGRSPRTPRASTASTGSACGDTARSR